MSVKVYNIKDKKVLIDEEDFPFISRFSWHLKKSGPTYYAVTNISIQKKQTTVSMHRMIMGLKDCNVDHINRNGLDNRKENLRLCEFYQNQFNRIRGKNPHGFRGVTKNNYSYGYQIQVGGTKYRKSGFKTAKEAAMAYDKKSKQLHKEFGIRNFDNQTLKDLGVE